MSIIPPKRSVELHPFIEGLVDIFHDAAIVLQNPAVYQEERLEAYGLEALFSGILLRTLHHANPLFPQADPLKSSTIAQHVSNEIVSWAADSYKYSTEQSDQEFGKLMHYIRFSVWSEHRFPFDEMKVLQSFQQQNAVVSLLYIYGMLLEASERMNGDLQANTAFSLQTALESTSMLLLEICDPSDSFWELDSDIIAEAVSRCMLLLENWLHEQLPSLSFLTDTEEESQELFSLLTSKAKDFILLAERELFSAE